MGAAGCRAGRHLGRHRAVHGALPRRAGQGAARALRGGPRSTAPGRCGEFFAVGLPALRGELAVAITLTVVAALQDLRPGLRDDRAAARAPRPRVPSYEVYRRAFDDGRGRASACTIGVVLTVDHHGDHDRRQPDRASGDRLMRVVDSSGALTYAVLVAFARLRALPARHRSLGTALQPDRSAPPAAALRRTSPRPGTRAASARYLRNSVIVSVVVVVLSAVLSCLAGYAFGTMGFRGADAAVLPAAARADGAERGDRDPAVLRPARDRADRHYCALIARRRWRSRWPSARSGCGRTSAARSREIVEAARLDGAGHRRVLW